MARNKRTVRVEHMLVCTSLQVPMETWEVQEEIEDWIRNNTERERYVYDWNARGSAMLTVYPRKCNHVGLTGGLE